MSRLTFLRSITSKMSTFGTMALMIVALTTSQLLHAQTYPTFTSGAKLPMNTNYSPSAAAFNGKLYLAYSNRSDHGYLYVSTSSDGVNYSNPGKLLSNYAQSLGYAMAAYNGKLYIAQNYGDQIQMISTSDGTNWSTATANIASTVYGWKPSLTVFNNSLYLAFAGDNGAGGPFADVAYTTDGVNFSGFNQVSTTQLSSGLAISSYNNKLYVEFIETTAHHPVLSSSSDGFTWSSVEDSGITFGGDPALADFNGALFLAGRTNYSENNLWMTGTYDGTNFSAQKKYGQSLTQSPGLTVFNGALYQFGKSNYGTNIWYYAATY